MMFEARSTNHPQTLIWFNLEHVLFAIPFEKRGGVDDGYMRIEFTNGLTLTLANNWKDRDDVARFKEAMGMKND